MFCKACGADNDATHQFCSSCGQKLMRVCQGCQFGNSPQASFCGQCGKPLDAVNPPAGNFDSASAQHGLVGPGNKAERDERTEVSTEGSVERRQVTVLFCDLVGSTALSSRIDPEDLSELYRTYRQAAGNAILSFDGHVAEYLGDGIVAYFGYPSAMEKAASRSILAGLAMIDAVRSSTVSKLIDAPLSIRIGIATGIVVAGDLLGEADKSQVRTVVGETPNLAARLQSIAPVNSIVISDSTRRLVGNEFRMERMAPERLKGITGLVEAFQVHGPASAMNLSGASSLDCAMVGREQELAHLKGRWSDAVAGTGQTVLIKGEAGIGKSRLVRALTEHLADQTSPNLVLTLQASNIYQNTAFYPVIEMLRMTFGFTPDNTDAALQQMEAALVTSDLEKTEALPLFCALLSIPYHGVDATAGMSAEARRRRTLDILLRWLDRLCKVRPVLLLVEDLHWVDPSTMEFLERLIAHCDQMSVLMLVTCRPELQSNWQERPNVTSLTLERLRQEDVLQLVAALAESSVLSPATLQTLIEKSDGVPLFVEELTRSMLESMEPAVEDADKNPHGAAHPVPATLRDSLMARLDRLDSAKFLIQRAAVIGREFEYRILSALSHLDEAALMAEIGRLMEAQLLYQSSLAPLGTYTFRHALIQDIAYESLLKRRRQELHGELAQILISRFSDVESREPEVVAQHLARGGRISDSMPYFLRAARYARDNSAKQEAVNQLRIARDWLKSLPVDPDRDQLELSLLTEMEGPLIASKGYTSPELKDVCSNALVLCENIGSSPDLALALHALSTYYLNVSDLVACREAADKILKLSQRPDCEAHRVIGLVQSGFVDLFSGEHEAALSRLPQVLACYDRQRWLATYLAYGQDPCATAYAQAAQAAWYLGRVDLAVEYASKGVSVAKEIGDPFTQAMTSAFLGYIHIHRQDRAMTLKITEENIARCEQQHFPQWLHMAHVCHGWALADGSASTPQGLGELRSALEALSTVGAVVGAPMFMSLLVESLMAAGANDPALAVIDRTLQESKGRGNIWMDAELVRLRVAILSARPEADPSHLRAELEAGLVLARRTKNRVHETRSLCMAHRLHIARAEDYRRINELAEELVEGESTNLIIELRSIAALSP